MRFVGILMLDGDLNLGPLTGTYYSLFQKEISNIPTVTPNLFNPTRRSTGHNISVTKYKSVIKTAMTGRQPVTSLRLSTIVGIFTFMSRKNAEWSIKHFLQSGISCQITKLTS